MRRAALLAAAFLCAAMPAAAHRIPEGGCIQRKLAVVTQGSKLMGRCHAQAARQTAPLDHGCLTRVAARMKNGLARLDRSGCARTQDADALISLTAEYVSAVRLAIAESRKPASATPSPAAPPSTPGLTPAAD